MVHYCCAYNCKVLFQKGGPVTFHSFPKDPERRRLWEVKIKRADFKATDHSKICSKHFTPDSFDTTRFGGTWLKPNAIPSIFDFTKHSEEETTKIPQLRKSPPKRGISPDKILHQGSSTKPNSEEKQLRLDKTDVSRIVKKMQQISQAEVSNSKQTIHNLKKENKIPKHSGLRSCWSRAISDKLSKANSTVLSSQHFPEQNSEESQSSGRLSSNVVPSIFDFSNNSHNVVKQICCVPSCESASEKQEPFVTFHEFPSHPDLSAKWIQQINFGISDYRKPMWVPRGKAVICSKHFVQTAFKDDSDTLKPRAIPTIFGHKYIGLSEQANKVQTPATKTSDPPLIFKLVRQSAKKEKSASLNIINQNGSSKIYKENLLRSDDVSGNFVDMQAGKDTSADLQETDDNGNFEMDVPSSLTSSKNKKYNTPKKLKRIRNFPNKPCALFKQNKSQKMDETKYLHELEQKFKVIETFKLKVASLTKKIEELDSKYRAQERHMSSSLIKKVAKIRKNADRGDSRATYILEQIDGYTEKYMQWSDSTLSQCAVWVKKASYAYEYFKKAEFFKLPCLSTVKRFIKNHPELKFQNKKIASLSNNDSSSDFDFGSDSEEDDWESISNKENYAVSTTCKTIVTESSVSKSPIQCQEVKQNDTTNLENLSNFNDETFSNVQEPTKEDNSEKIGNSPEISILPVNIDGSSSEVEIVLSNGEVLHCYTSNICNGSDGSQYYFIPNAAQNSDENHVEVNDEILSVIQQNFKNSQQDVIVITNSSEQSECTEIEVAIPSSK